MVIQKGRYVVSALFGLLTIVLMSACGGVTVTPPGSGSSLTVVQVLQNSSATMQKLKSAHFTLLLNGNVQGSSGATPTSGTPTANQLSFNLTGKGDESIPQGQQSLTITLNQTLNLSEIVIGDKVYVQNSKGQWYVLDKSKLAGLTTNPFAGVNVDTNTLLGLAVHSKITDHGAEALNGQKLRHITAVLDKEGLKELLKNSPQLGSMVGQQNIDTIINNTKNFLASIDLWIDETNFYVHRTELKLNLNADLSGLATPASTVTTVPSSVTTNLDSIVDLSDFDKPVNITAPANAIPTDNPVNIFQ
ncbi:MAG: LppX_LprAFG lipoprotein [Ktedonobacteraceae bacterium]|nr:LppX_LprAFG lipoprotein [Ktedonobacteraceae bacterium]